MAPRHCGRGPAAGWQHGSQPTEEKKNVSRLCRRERERVLSYTSVPLRFIRRKWICSLKDFWFGWFDIGIRFKDETLISLLKVVWDESIVNRFTGGSVLYVGLMGSCWEFQSDSIKSLKVKRIKPRWVFDPSLRISSVKSSVARLVLEPVLEARWSFWDFLLSSQKVWKNFIWVCGWDLLSWISGRPMQGRVQGLGLAFDSSTGPFFVYGNSKH